MAKERLSKLQKWILVECYKRRNEDFPKGLIARWKLVDMFNKITPSAEVSISRSIWSLIDKEYATGLSPMKVSDMAIIYWMMGKSIEEFNKRYGQYKLSEEIVVPTIKGQKVKVITLTDKGAEKAKELLMLNTDTVSKLNNKKIVS